MADETQHFMRMLVTWCCFEKSYQLRIILILPTPYISESCIQIKINLNFYFTLLSGASEGYMKAFIKPFEAPHRSVKIKN